MSSVGIIEPDGILKGWNRSVRTTSAMSSAWTITLTVSAKPPSSFFFAWLKFLGRTPTGSLIIGSRFGAPTDEAGELPDRGYIGVGWVVNRAKLSASEWPR